MTRPAKSGLAALPRLMALLCLLRAGPALADEKPLILKLPGTEIDITAITKAKSDAKSAATEVKDSGNILKLSDILQKYLTDKDVDVLNGIKSKLAKWNPAGADDASATRLRSLANFCDEADAEVTKFEKICKEVADKNDPAHPLAAKLLRDKEADLELHLIPALREIRNTASDKIKAIKK